MTTKVASTPSTAARARDKGASDLPGGPIQRSVPAAGQPLPATSAPRSAFDLVPKKAGTPKTRMRLDITAIEVRVGVPIPEDIRRPRPGNSYADLTKRMPVGSCVELPERCACSLVSAGTKAGIKFTRRRLNTDGLYGVWRVE